MFDGLKDKLSGFTSDVEEDVDDEAAEDEAVDDEAVDDEAVDDEEAVSEPEADTESEADTTAEADDASTDSDDATSPDADSTPEPPAEAASTEDASVDEDVPADDTSRETDADEVSGAADADDASPEADADDASGDEATDDVPTLAPDEEDDDSGGRSFTEKAKIMATGKTVIEEEDLQKHLDDLELALLSSDVEMSVANEILSGVEENLTGETRRRLSSTGNLVRDALREALFDVISVGQFDFDERVQAADKPVVIIFTGVNGVGKTTTIAKLARYFEDRGLSTVLANGDTYRAGANEQLEKHAQNLDKKIITHEQGSDPTAVVYDAVEYAKANDIDVVLGDTAGRLHTSDDLMAQLAKIDRNIDPDMTLFVDEAVAGQDAVNRAREFDDAAEIDGAVLTKADADPQGGAAISVAHVTGKPILFLGTGQDYGDLEPFDPEEIVDSLFAE
ncbi:signal recognition particle-docking protein FtsY [Haloarcula sp. S1CR25-12]|uniref:Signal recognition particle receptor FtsY n=1 Tax=Haloarcula saliterrae TaxID=2950534 RepID=A0ABU2FDG8_9EURY|nr:signal recognition particle-docking protein FtsY [Haloarcula sp. S1CR25-12]MDS0259885.1 signal recognition particle-docking protein FtsY [Haloarcula sp. S1CR25-12]